MHGLKRAGKKKQQYLEQINEERVRVTLDPIRLIISPLFVREIFVRYLLKSFKTITAILYAQNVHKKFIPRFLDSVTNEANTHLINMNFGIWLLYKNVWLFLNRKIVIKMILLFSLDEPPHAAFEHIQLDLFPVAILYVWQLNKAADCNLHPGQYDYSNISVGAIGITRVSHDAISQAQCLENSKTTSEIFGQYSKSVREVPNFITNKHGENSSESLVL